MTLTSVTVTGTFHNQDGTTASGRVSFRLSTALVDAAGNVLVAPVLKTVDLSAGAFSTTLYATDAPGISPSGVTYTVTENLDGAPTRSYAVTIPYDAAGGTVDLADLAPVSSSTITYAEGLYLTAIIQPGTAVVADDVLPPGLYVPRAGTLSSARVRVGTAPTGAALIVEVLADDTTVATVTVADGETSAVESPDVSLSAGAVLTFNLTQVGSSTAGTDVAVDLSIL